MITPKDFIMSKPGVDFSGTVLNEGSVFERGDGVSEIVFSIAYETDKLTRFNSIRRGESITEGVRNIIESGYSIVPDTGEARQSFSGVYYERDTPVGNFVSRASERFTELDSFLTRRAA